MRSLADTALLLHHGRSPATPLSTAELERAVGWARDVVVALKKLHRFSDFHGSVSPDTVNIGPRGARLLAPNFAAPPPEYRDPERGRWILKDTRTADSAQPRHDVYGAGALLFHLLEGGPPTCGHMAPFTRNVPPAAAYIVGRAMAEGDSRYATVDAMLSDVDRFLALLQKTAPDEIRSEDLPSFTGGRAPAAKKLVPFAVRERREKRVRPWRRLLAFLLVLVITGGIIYHQFPGDVPPTKDPAAQAPSGPMTLDGLLTDWQSRLHDRLMASGEALSPTDVPLIVVSEVPIQSPRGWPIHPSGKLTQEIRALLNTGARPERIQERLLELSGRDTLPAVLWVTEGSRPGMLNARLYYRTIMLESPAKR
jgi:hypothetical protein